MIEGEMKQITSNVNAKIGNAVDVPKKHWFVAIVNNNSEKVYGEKLGKLGYESYVLVQSEIHRWRNGQVKTIDRNALSAVAFVGATEMERRKEIVILPFIKHLLIDKALKVNERHLHPVAVTPDSQLILPHYAATFRSKKTRN